MDVLARFGILSSLRASGTRLVGCCPIHQGSNKKQFSVTGGTGPVAFLAVMDRVDRREATHRLLDWFPPPYSARANQRRRAMTGNRPTHKVLADTGRPDPNNPNRTMLVRIGAAWPLKQGSGLSIMLDALPLNQRLVLLEIQDEAETGEPFAKQT